MAIKTVSQLDRFDNGNNSYGSFAIGGKLHLLSGETLTDKDTAINVPENWHRTDGKWIPGRANDSYWGALFEISKPKTVSNSSPSDSAVEYESQSITYQNLMENIVWDAKTYLNARHNLSNFDFLSVIHGNYTFTGNKTFTNNVDVNSTLTSLNLIATNSYLTNLTATNLTANQLSVRNTLHISCDITANDRDRIFDGYVYGLVDRNPNNHNGALTHNKTTVGTKDGTVSRGLLNQDNRTGDPVCFVQGRPYELTAVNYAMSAYMLVNRDGSLLSAGNGEIRTVGGITGTAQDTNSKYSAMFIHGGTISATNVIDFAEHAYWSDLGERYLANDIYEPGTLVKFGGEKEITIADNEVNAIVSTKAFDLNAGLVGGTVIALCGRVPTKVKGKIEKFDKIMLSDIPGVACKWDGASRVIGRALESNLNEDIKLVECVTRFEI